jgi:hypothetical protein
MHSTLKPKQADDPHDFVVVPPDAVRVAPSDDELSDLLRAAARQHLDPQGRNGPDLPAGSEVPAVDTTFRPAAVDDVLGAGRRSMGRRAMRAIAAVLLAACIGAAAMGWQASGYAAKKLIARWLPQFAMTTSLPLDKLGLGDETAPPAAEVDAANAVPPQPAPPAQTATDGVAANAAAQSPDSAQLLQSMARDLASVTREVEQLKASIAELRASQQVSRDMVKSPENKASEQNARARISALPPRPAVAHARKPPPPYSPAQTYPPAQAATAPVLPQAAAPYVPRQVEPLAPPASQPLADPGLESAPRPPMPIR